MATLKINGADLWYEIGGPADGGQGTILFVHGLMAANWCGDIHAYLTRP